MYEASLKHIQVFGERGKQPGQFEQPNDITADDEGRIYVADLHRIQIFTSVVDEDLNIEYCYKGHFVVACPEYKQQIWGGTSCIVYNSSHKELVLPVVYKACGLAARTIQFHHLDGTLKHQFTNSNMASGLRIAVNDDRVLISDWTLHCIFIHNREGECLHKIASSDLVAIEYPYFICIGHHGDIIVSNYGQNNIITFDKKYNFKSKFGCPGHKLGDIKTPTGVAVDKLGHVIVAEKDNKRVQFFRSDGTFVKCIGNSEDGLNWPKGMLVHNDSLYVVDNVSNNVKVFDI
ncbi:tripartite motif-containing protein 2-like isoform X2 [Lingula anatina]|nr:tripartite motif-containing protein 2-like isoform X2 [Lingula anatina]|eukprot:XP_013417990.1 tripartite motif-containing protein 2-like isoform X2 [Lingula anatina]